MKITKSQLRQIILEEFEPALEEHKLQFAVGAIHAVLEDMKDDKVLKNLNVEFIEYHPARTAIRKLKSIMLRYEKKLENLNEPSDGEVEDVEDVSEPDPTELTLDHFIMEETKSMMMDEGFVQRVKYTMMHKVFDKYTKELMKISVALDAIDGPELNEFENLLEEWVSVRDDLKSMSRVKSREGSSDLGKKDAGFAKKGLDSFLQGFGSPSDIFK